MNDKQFDDLIKKRLEQCKTSVPKDMWQRIVEHESDRKGGFFIKRNLLITIFTLLIFCGGLFLLHLFDLQSIYKRERDLQDAVINIKTNKPGYHKTVPAQNAKNIKVGSNEKNHPNIKLEQSLSLSVKKQTLRRFRFNVENVKKTSKDSDSILKGDRQDMVYKNGQSDTVAKIASKELDGKKFDSLDNTIPEDKGALDKFSVEIFASPNMPINNISSNNKVYENFLKDAVKAKLSYIIGARLQYHFSRRVSGLVGLQYTQSNERINYVDSTPINRITTTNHYKNIGIPLLVTYKLDWRNSLHLSINTGIILNIYSQHKGIIPSITGEPINVATNKVYNKGVSLSLYFGINISRSISKRVDLFAEPFLNYQLKNMVSDFYSFNQQMHASGVFLGFRYYLFKNVEQPK